MKRGNGMALTLSDMDNFTLSELDDFTLQELDSMSYDELVCVVQEKCRIADEKCDKEAVLSETQIQAITAIVHSYTKEHDQKFAQKLTSDIAICAIWELVKFCTTTAIEHAPEIVDALKQAYLLLEQFLQQIPK